MDQPIVLIHSGWPWVDEGAFVASILPHVYLDTSLSTPWASLAIDSRLEILLGIAPPAKVMYGSDEASEPEVIWLSALLAREALARVLETGIARRQLNREAARRIGAGVMGGNARRLHGLGAGRMSGEWRTVRERFEAAGVRALAMTMVDNGGITRVKAVPVGPARAGGRKRRRHGLHLGGGRHRRPVRRRGAVRQPERRHAPDPRPGRRPRADGGAGLGVGAGRPDEPGARARPGVPAQRRSPRGRRGAGGRPRDAGDVRDRGDAARRATAARRTPGPATARRALALLDAFLLDLVDALEAAGIEVEQFHPEYAPGQFEVSIAARDPLAAADDLVFVRTQMRFAARRHGLTVSFAPIVFPGEVGNGCHAHLSVWRDGRNLMQGGGRPGGLTDAGAAALGGVVTALPELLAVLAPSPAAYLRLQPHHWAGAYACWGVENREAAVRFIPGTVTSRERSANFEVKVCDGGANPYVVVALLAAAAPRRRRARRRAARPRPGRPRRAHGRRARAARHRPAAGDARPGHRPVRGERPRPAGPRRRAARRVRRRATARVGHLRGAC